MAKDLKPVVRSLCDVLQDVDDLDVSDALAVVGAVAEMLLVNGVTAEGRIEAADKFYGVIMRRIGVSLN